MILIGGIVEDGNFSLAPRGRFRSLGPKRASTIASAEDEPLDGEASATFQRSKWRAT